MIKMMNLNDHLTELKRRLIFCFAILLISIVACYVFSSDIMEFLLKPLLTALDQRNIKRNIIYTDLSEAFTTKMKLAIFSGLIAVIPIILWQIYMFIAPGLFRREKKLFIFYLFCSTIMFLSGAVLVYYNVMPLAWDFFLSFEESYSMGANLILEAKISEYLSLVINMILAFGITFQLPILIIILCQAGLLKYKDLVSSRKYAIVVLFAFSAIITPPDVMSQIILAIPLILLYEISILICYRIQ